MDIDKICVQTTECRLNVCVQANGYGVFVCVSRDWISCECVSEATEYRVNLCFKAIAYQAKVGMKAIG